MLKSVGSRWWRGLAALGRWEVNFIVGLGRQVSWAYRWWSAGLWWLVSLPFKISYRLLLLIGHAGKNFWRGLAAIRRPQLPRAPKITWPTWSWQPTQRSWRAAAYFSAAVLFLVAPAGLYYNYREVIVFKNRLWTAASAAIGDLQSAKDQLSKKDLDSATGSFRQAGKNFWELQNQISQINDGLLALAAMAPNDKLKLAGSAEVIVEAGRQSALLGATLTTAVNSLLQGGTLTYRLENFNTKGQEALATAEKLEQLIQVFDERAAPEEYRAIIKTLKEQGGQASAALREALEVSRGLSVFLGDRSDKRYLLLFQNTTEARATGGFTGSFAVIDFSRGQLKKMTTPSGGTYDVEAGMRRWLAAPEPLRLVRARWMMWDANWWPDWPTSAKKIMWFYEKSDGPTVDGVISLTPQVVIDLLKIVGPIELPQYGETITADNFLEIIQTYAEQKAEVTNKPKAIIGDLSQALFDKLGSQMNQALLVKLLAAAVDNFEQKNILLYFEDQNLQDKVVKENWDGSLRATTGDYLQVVNSNIAGGKSDRRILQSVEQRTEIQADGSLINRLLIKREHTAIRGELFSGVRNVNWLRVYVPLGSELLSADGWRLPDAAFFDEVGPDWEVDELLINELSAKQVAGAKVYREGDKTVFAGWSMVDPGETTLITLTYKLPFKLTALTDNRSSDERQRRWRAGDDDAALYKYTLLAQKQSGSNNSRLKFSLIVPQNKRIVWQYPASSALPYRQQLTDQFITYLLADN